MKQFNIKFLLFVFALSVSITACRKEPINPTPVNPTPVRRGLYILAEGGFNGNNSKLSYYDYDSKTLTEDKFNVANSRGLGDTGNDAQIYGDKLYVVVNVSSVLEIMDAQTAKSIKQISFKNGSVDRQPRYIVFNQNKAFISCYDGTVAVLNTVTLVIEKFIPVGRNPEHMAIANGKLYVANSGGLSYPNYDKTVSVIDLNTLTETKKITVTDNPNGVDVDSYGDVYVLSTGDYGSIKPAMAIIDSKTDAVKQTFNNFSASFITISGDYAYIGTSGAVKLFNVKNETLEKDNFITDGTTFTAIHGVNYDPINKELFVMDAKNYASNGEVFCFNKDGVRQYTLKLGINPTAVAFLNRQLLPL